MSTTANSQPTKRYAIMKRKVPLTSQVAIFIRAWTVASKRRDPIKTISGRRLLVSTVMAWPRTTMHYRVYSPSGNLNCDVISVPRDKDYECIVMISVSIPTVRHGRS